MQSLVIGATGMVGGQILKRLAATGERPWALSRSPQREDPRVRWIAGDLARPQALQVGTIDRLFCTADIRLLAPALPALITPELRRVVVFTTTSLLTKRDSEIAQERSEMRALADAERVLMETCEQRGITFTVLRPTMIYSEGRDQNVTRIARFIRRFGFFPLAGSGRGLRQPVHAEDLAIGAIAASASPAAANQVYNLCGAETVTYREMVGRVCDGLGRPRLVVPTPQWAWRVAYAAAKPLLPQTNVAMGMRMSKDMVFDCASAARDFGWNPRPFRPRFQAVLDR